MRRVQLKIRGPGVLPGGALPPSRSHLVTEDFDLAVGPVHWFVAAVVVTVGVDLDVKRQPLHTLLGREIGAQAVHGDEHLGREEKALSAAAPQPAQRSKQNTQSKARLHANLPEAMKGTFGHCLCSQGEEKGQLRSSVHLPSRTALQYQP